MGTPPIGSFGFEEIDYLPTYFGLSNPRPSNQFYCIMNGCQGLLGALGQWIINRLRFSLHAKLPSCLACYVQVGLIRG